MHVTLSVPIEIEAFGGSYSVEFFVIKKIMTFHTVREVEEFRELSKNTIKRVGHQLSFSDN